MLCHLANPTFPVQISNLDNKQYWTCRVGGGNEKNKDLMAYYEKGRTTIYMIERLMNNITSHTLRLPEEYKRNVYAVLKWMIMNFDSLINKNNMDINNKRIRKNEYIVVSSLGKKISENINKIIEKKSNSKMNTMDTLLEIFNFNSDIILNSMRIINDLIKSDERVNDASWLEDMAFSFKGPNSLGEASSKMIATRYRNIHSSYIAVIDVNCSSNSDVGMSGSFTPFVELYDNFYFTPDKEPCSAEYELEMAKQDYFNSSLNQSGACYVTVQYDSLDDFIKCNGIVNNPEDLEYEKIEIVEKPKDEIKINNQ
jgi:phosphopantetheine adenylyltransferase